MVFDTIKMAKLNNKIGYHINKTPKIRCTIVLSLTNHCGSHGD